MDDVLNIFGNSQQTLAVSTTAAATPRLSEGVYDIWCDESDAYLKCAEEITGLTTSTGYVLKLGNVVAIEVPEGARIGVILPSGTGTFRYFKVR